MDNKKLDSKQQKEKIIIYANFRRNYQKISENI